MTALKAALVDALRSAITQDGTTVELESWGEGESAHEAILMSHPYTDGLMIDPDRLVAAITNHFLDLESLSSVGIFNIVNRAINKEITPERASDMIKLACLEAISDRGSK